jgi:hypothetical protein
VAGFALLDTGEAYALNFELNPNQGVQVHAGDQHIAAGGTRLCLREAYLAAERVEDFERKEGDLAFVVLLEIEESVAAYAAPGDALDLVHFDDGVLAGGLFVVAKKVMAERDKKLMNLDQATGNIGRRERSSVHKVKRVEWIGGKGCARFAVGRCSRNGYKLLVRMSSAGNQRK